MSHQSNPQEFVILQGGSQADNLPFGYEFVVRDNLTTIREQSPVGATEESLGVSEGTKVPHILSVSPSELITLADGTVVASSVEVVIDSEYKDVELRIVEGDRL